MTWLICDMDNGIISEHPTKRDAVDAVERSTWGPLRARRLRAGEYEYTCRCDSEHCREVYVMTEAGAARNGWERDDA